MFDLERIKQETSVAQIDFHEEIGSTNDRAIELIKQNAIPLPALVLTNNQTAGRGQRERTWWSNNGSLTFTWITSDSQLSCFESANSPGAVASRSLLPIIVANATCKAIEATTGLRNIAIKWPNDLLVENRKLSGVLIESIRQGNKADSDQADSDQADSNQANSNQPRAHDSQSNPNVCYAVGIGINVNNNQSELETGGLADQRTQSDRTLSLQESATRKNGDENSKTEFGRPTSIHAQISKNTSLEDLLIGIIKQLNHDTRQLRTGQGNPINEIVETYNQRLAFRGQEIRINQAGQTERLGICQGINSEGNLLLQTSKGIEAIFSGIIQPV